MSRISRDINTIDRSLRLRRREYMESQGLKGGHARYFMEICHTPGISQDRLAQRLYYDKSNVARQAAFLEENGYLRREPSKEDKRVMCLYPTEKMRAMMPDLERVTETWEEALTRELTDQEKEQFTQLLAKVRAVVRRED